MAAHTMSPREAKAFQKSIRKVLRAQEAEAQADLARHQREERKANKRSRRVELAEAPF